MSGIHARPASTLFRSAPGVTAVPAAHGAEPWRRGGFVRRLRREIHAYRDIEFYSTRIPGNRAGVEEDCLLLVHVRKVVGQIHYRTYDNGLGQLSRGQIPDRRLPTHLRLTDGPISRVHRPSTPPPVRRARVVHTPRSGRG